MKISQLSTVQAKDVLIQLAALTANITEDEPLMNIIGQAMSFDGLNNTGVKGKLLGKWSAFVSELLKSHWPDVRGILSALNNKSVDEVEAQSLFETMRQINELRDDKELIDFLSSLTGRAKTAQSAPSVTAPTASPLSA